METISTFTVCTFFIAQHLSKQRSSHAFQWQKVKTPPFGMLWPKIRTTRRQNIKNPNTQKKHKRISRKSLGGNPSSALKSFKSLKPTTQVNMCIIKLRLTNIIWQPIGSEILTESAFPFCRHQVKQIILCCTFDFPLFYPETKGILNINLKHLT